MREKSMLREGDVSASDLVSQFLDETFYSKQCKNVERVLDKERQVKGIDIIFDYGGKCYLCDEKAAIRYINRPLKTFSFELSFINRNGEEQEGWLTSDKEENNSFLLIWVDKAKKDFISEVSDIQEICFALVQKDKIVDFMSSLGWTKNKLRSKQKQIREGRCTDMGNVYTKHCKFAYSTQLVEKPINILLSREDLIRISDYNETIKNMG